MASRRITINLETEASARVSLESFQSALDNLAMILHEVELEISERKRAKLSWEIAELALGSAVIGLEAAFDEDTELADQTCQTVIRGLEQLTQEQTRPKYFNDTALERAMHLARIANDGISHINLYSDIAGQQIYITENIAVNVHAILEHIEFFGSVEGPLEVLSGREGEALYFRVRDVATGAGVRCFFPEEMLEKALQYFRKRVVVSGSLHCDSAGKPRRIYISKMELVPPVEDLPQPEDVRGTLEGQTKGIPSERYLKETFGGR